MQVSIMKILQSGKSWFRHFPATIPQFPQNKTLIINTNRKLRFFPAIPQNWDCESKEVGKHASQHHVNPSIRQIMVQTLSRNNPAISAK